MRMKVVAEIPFELRQSAADHMRLPPDVQASVIARGFHPIDVRHIDEKQPPRRFDDNPARRLRMPQSAQFFPWRAASALMKRASSKGFSR